MGYAARGRCGHRIALIRRAGNDDAGDRDSVLIVRAYSIRVKITDIVPVNHGGGKVNCTINPVGQVYKQNIEFAFLDGAITADRGYSIKKTRRLQRAWTCFQRY